MPSRPVAALVRPPTDDYARCLRVTPGPIDPARAAAQHAGYVDALRAAGVEVIRLPPLPGHPDAVFVEDTAVVLRDGVLLTHPGAPSRRGEVDSVAHALAGRMPSTRMSPPATLDGGDVLRVGETLFVGRSARTDAAGVAQLRAAAGRDGLRVVVVPVAQGLHLKSACTIVDAGAAVVDTGALDPAPLRAAGLEILAVDEPHGANVLALGPVVLVSAAAPRTLARLRERGVDARPVAVDELHRGDGALTCLSIRLPPTGGWVS